MNSFINIEPCDLIQTISKIKVVVLYLELNNCATIRTLCYDVNENILNSYTFELKQPEYSEWINDDWLINYVCQKYGYIIQNPVPEPVIEPVIE